MLNEKYVRSRSNMMIWKYLGFGSQMMVSSQEKGFNDYTANLAQASKPLRLIPLRCKKGLLILAQKRKSL